MHLAVAGLAMLSLLPQVWAATLTATPYAPQLRTTLANGNTGATDSWSRNQAFRVLAVNVGLAQYTFSKAQYAKGDTVIGSFVITNLSSTPLQDVHLEVSLTDPSGSSVGGVTSGTFSINGNSAYLVTNLAIWQMPASALSGAYLPVVAVKDGANQTLASFAPSGSSAALPVLPMGALPRLNALIVRSQEHFSAANASGVATVIQQFHDAGISHLSISVKLDDGSGLWPASIAYSGRILFTSTNATPSGAPSLPYDLYQLAQAAGQAAGVVVNPWIPTFYDRAALTDHPGWQLAVNAGQQQQDFVDASLAEVRNYETTLILGASRTPYAQPGRVTIDHFRYTYGQHGSSFITAFVSNLKSSLPAGTRLDGYMWLPADTWWSGQDYASLQPYLDVMSPMLYWQTSVVPAGRNVPEGARDWVTNAVRSIVSVIGSAAVQQKVGPTLSITSSGTYSDGTAYSLDDFEWRRTQFNVLGALGDSGIRMYDMFYHGNWFRLIDSGNPSLGRWVDRAASLASLAGTAAPNLHAARQSNGLVLSWPTNASGFVLQNTTALSGGSWTASTTSPVVVNANYVVTNTISSNSMFYRLGKP
jgi:hypothetical protein